MHDKTGEILAPAYDPKAVEERLYARWEASGAFRAEAGGSGEPYTIVIPPPNVTGFLHIGHALNNSVQDIIIRHKRMQGFRALWIPGTDHAGIATQNVVEKELAREGGNRQDLGREKFLERVWAWREQYGNRILYQLKRLGSSCDWERTRFTMDEGLTRAVREVFVRLHEAGLIYRGSYIINWCPRCQTALADEEAPREDAEGKLYHIRYPLEENGKPSKSRFIEVATTRPETMLGDTAVAVHPEDERYREWIGKHVILPLVGRRLPVIADAMVEKEFGTGAVKITPAHDPADFATGKRHNLEFINVMTDDARMTNVPKAYEGLDRYDCRSRLIVDLEQQGYLGPIDAHAHAVGHCYRCKTTIEPRLSPQWFVRMQPLAEPALAASRKGEVTFFPERWTKVYHNWLENIQDWCISRQIWWGHRIPVWYCDDCKDAQGEPRMIVAREEPRSCPGCGSAKLRQDEDVLDTWFSSWLWPFSTLGWPENTEDLKVFYPTQTLVTAPEIIFFWVARMIMAGFFCTGKAPFSRVYLHGTVRDAEGRKMSKSLGNSIDPLVIIDKYGADALRYTLVTATGMGNDILLSEDRVLVGRNFANKLWNAARFVVSQIPAAEWAAAAADVEAVREGRRPGAFEPTLADRWILSQSQRVVERVTQSLERFLFHDAAQALYDFIWHDVCDWYLETAKIQLNGDRRSTLAVLGSVFDTLLRLLHPVMPFVTEELWGHLKDLGVFGRVRGDDLIAQAWPRPLVAWRDGEAEAALQRVQAVITHVRTTRADLHMPPQSRLKVSFKTSAAEERLIRQSASLIEALARTEPAEFISNEKRPAGAIAAVVEGIEVFVHVQGMIDVPQEVRRLEEAVREQQRSLEGTRQRLANPQFTDKAPPEVIEQSRARCGELEDLLRKSRAQLEALRSMSL